MNIYVFLGDEHVDILCFTETRLSQTIADDVLKLEGFDPAYRKDKSVNSGGLLTYVSCHLHSKRILQLEHNLPESLWLEIKDTSNSYLICNIYRPPNTTVEFWNRLNTTIEKAFETSNKIIIVGDINEDQLDLRNHHFKDVLLLNNMSNVIIDATRVSPTSRTLIDPIAITNNIQSLHSGIFQTDSDLSDHYGTYMYSKTDLISQTPFSCYNFCI